MSEVIQSRKSKSILGKKEYCLAKLWWLFSATRCILAAQLFMHFDHLILTLRHESKTGRMLSSPNVNSFHRLMQSRSSNFAENCMTDLTTTHQLNCVLFTNW